MGANVLSRVFLLAAAIFSVNAKAVCEPAAQAASLDAAVVVFKPQVQEWIVETLSQAKLLRERVAARDLPGAQQAWLAARGGWERAEVVTDEFFPDLDTAIDAWPDGKTGFHAIEAKLFGAHQLDVLPHVDALVDNLSDFEQLLLQKTLTAQGLLNGIAKLAFEVGDNKASGGESPFSGNSIVEMGHNVAGIMAAYRTVFAGAVKAGNARLGAATERAIDQLQQIVAVPDMKRLNQDKLRQRGEELAASFREIAPVIGLDKPKLEN
jgi:iron uptake system EfeUOB component EfeO/EfeM